MTFEEAYQQIRENHYKILDERESISKSARLSLSTWILDILTECREADTPQTERDAYWKELFEAVVKGEMSDASANQAWYEYINKQDTPQTDCEITECDYHKYCKERGQTDCGWK